MQNLAAKTVIKNRLVIDADTNCQWRRSVANIWGSQSRWRDAPGIDGRVGWGIGRGPEAGSEYPLPSLLAGLENVVSSSSRVRVGAPAENKFGAFFTPIKHFWWNYSVASDEIFLPFVLLPWCDFQWNDWNIHPGYLDYTTRRPNITGPGQRIDATVNFP